MARMLLCSVALITLIGFTEYIGSVDGANSNKKTKTHNSSLFFTQVKMSALDEKKDEAETNNNNNNNNNKSIVLETNLDEDSTASDSARGAK